MKKSIMFLFLMFVTVFFCSFTSYADDAVYDAFGDAEMNANGHVTQGGIIDDTCAYDNSGTGPVYYLLPSNASGLYITTDGVCNYWLYSVDGSSIYVSGYYVMTKYGDPNVHYDWSRTVSSGYALYSSDLFLSAIPIFNKDDTDAIANYCNNGDKGGATNSSNWRDEQDSSIPLPHNLKVIKGVDQFATNVDVSMGYPLSFNRDVVVSWQQDDVIDGLKYEIEACFYYVKVGSDLKVKEYNTAYYPLASATPYNSSKNITATFSSSTLNSFYGIAGDKSLSKMTIRLRNKCGSLTSNWVTVTIDFKNKKASANEEAYDDDASVDGEYVNTDVNGDVDGGAVNSTVSTDGIKSYIQDGFGLLGNGGLISLMSSVFLYIPNSVWTIIKFFISSIVTISLFAFVIKVVF